MAKCLFTHITSLIFGNFFLNDLSFIVRGCGHLVVLLLITAHEWAPLRPFIHRSHTLCQLVISICLPQALCSSEPSSQSSSPSQTNPEEMHSPLVTHLNSSEVHDGAALTEKQTTQEFTQIS